MAQLERPQRQVETTKAPSTIHTMEQLLRGESSRSSKQSPTYPSSPSSNLSSPNSPFFQRLRSHDSEDDHSQNQKKSVLTKVKEKAKKLRHSLSKKKHEDGNLSSPSSATGAEGDAVEEDAEFLGAPMYESEKAPIGYKANAKHLISPRANHMIPEKHVISSSDKHVVEQDHEKSLTRSLSKRTTQPAATITTTTSNATPASNIKINSKTNTSTPSGPNKTTTETVTPKLSTVPAEKPDAARVTSKFQGFAGSKPSELHDHPSSSSSSSLPSSLSSSSSSLPTSTVAPKTIRNTSLSYSAPRTPPARVTSQFPTTTPRTTSAPVTPAPSPATPLSAKSSSPTAQIWDKGVSMKEYFLTKLEPGEDEKALSQVISEAMSPRRTPGDAGVMEKVREAVTSLLRTEQPAKYADETTAATTRTARMSPQSPVSTNASRASSQIASSSNASRASSQMPASTGVSRTLSQIPVSYNAQQEYTVAQEENHGRILQAN